jgi:diguanylate cyclase (GGDEF)-like protein
MNLDTYMNIVLELTKQVSAKDLKHVFVRLLEENLEDTRVELFEVHTIRMGDDTHLRSIVAVNALDYLQDVLYIDKTPVLHDCYSEGKTVLSSFGEGPVQKAFPIKEHEAISHIVVFSFGGKVIEEGTLDYFVGVFSNLLILLNSKDQDHLTGFFNRQAYNRMINPIIFGSKKKEVFVEKNKTFTYLAIIDIDHFKNVNDSYGHIIGDEILIIFSQIVRSTFRHDDLLFRYGGEEFVIILKDVENRYAWDIFERCRKCIAEHTYPQAGEITISIGFTVITVDSDRLTIIDRADKALYFAKNNGRNQTCSYEELVKEEKILPVSHAAGEVEIWD